MARSKSMGIGAMFVLLVVVIILLPIVVRYIDRMDVHYSISGFQGYSDDEVKSVPHVASAPNSNYVPDPNTAYLCNSPNNSGESCPEGTFCDGASQTCLKKTVPATSDAMGYYS